MTFRKGFRQPPAQGDSARLIKLFERNDWTSLEAAAREFMRKNPRHVLGPKALVASLTQQDRIEEALETLDAALVQFPNDAELHNNHAAALIKAGQCEKAVAAAEKAIQLNPKNGGAYANKGLALKHLGAFSSSLESYYKAIELNPEDYKSLNNAGVALIEMEAPEQAVICIEAALTLYPDFSEALFNLGRAKDDLKLLEGAKEEYLKVLQAQPDNMIALSRLVQVLRSQCDFAEASKFSETLLQRIRTGKPESGIVAFNVLALENATLADQHIAGYACASADNAEALSMPAIVTAAHDRDPHRPLRIGYLSADFHSHATLMLMIGLLETHHRSDYQIFNYSLGTDDNSALRKRAEKACTAFHNIRPLSYVDAARQIASDQIDILVDLKGYTKGARLNICALRPAPIIVSWLGYPGTLGHPRLADYIIGDPVVTPLEHQAHYSETLALMPHCYQSNDDARPIGAKPSRTELGLPESGMVFCSFNQTYKITAPVFDQWCRLLKSVPNSVIWLMAGKSEPQANLLARAATHGIEPARFVFASHAPILEHLGRLQNADLALDSFPYGSHTTGSDALWAGVPLVAIKGNTFASRVSASLLTNAGLPELIADSPEAACDMAIELALTPEKMAIAKARVAAAKHSSHLFNTDEFTRDLERMYRRMWKHHLAGEKAPIVLQAQGSEPNPS